MLSRTIAQAIARDAIQIEQNNAKILRDNLLKARAKLLKNPSAWQYEQYGKFLDEVLGEYEAAALEDFPVEETLEHGTKEGRLFTGADLNIDKSAKFWGWSPVLPLNAIAIEESKFADLITKATADFKKEALRTVQQGLAMGASTQDLMDDLLGVGVSGAKGKDGKFRKAVTRAETIARTVSNDLINKGAMITYGQIDRISPELNLQKIWQTLSDNRTSDRCRSLSGQKRELNEDFQAGDGWTGQNPPAHPNCRSRVTSRAKNRKYTQAIDDRFARGDIAAIATPQREPSPLSEALPKPPKKKRTTIPTTKGFPDSLNELKPIKRLGKNTELVEDANGRKFVKRTNGKAQHERNEAYAALGVKAPKSKLIGGAQLTEYVEGKPLSALSKSEQKKALAQLNKDFAKDALLGNKIGLEDVVLTPSGDVVRVGGKLGKIDKYPVELFGDRPSDLPFDDAMKQARALKKKALSKLPKKQRKLLESRIEEANRIGSVAKTLRDDKFNPEYTEKFTKHSLGIRRAGISDRLPSEIKLGLDNSFVDQDGKPFDHLRGEDSVVADLEDYMDGIGANYRRSVAAWMRGQSISSWSDESQSLKYLMAKARGAEDDVFWVDGIDEAKQKYNKSKEADPQYDEAFAAYHAYNYEMMSKMKAPNNDLKKGTFKLFRTEDGNILKSNGIKKGDVDTMKRGDAESASEFTPVQAVAGDSLTVQEVTHHRIIGNYFNSRN